MAILNNRVKNYRQSKRGAVVAAAFSVRFFLACVAIIFVTIVQFGYAPLADRFLTDISGQVGHVVSPLSSTISYVQHVTSSVTKFSKLYNENLILKAKLVEAERVRTELEISKTTAFQLGQQLNLHNGEVPNGLVTARILYTSSTDVGSMGIISAGTKDGISAGSIVVSNEGLVGRILEVGNSSSKILLVSDYNSKISVTNVRSKDKVILSGNGSGATSLSHAKTHFSAKIGDILVTSGDGKYYPYGIPVARIGSISNNNISVDTFYNNNSTEFVSIYPSHL